MMSINCVTKDRLKDAKHHNFIYSPKSDITVQTAIVASIVLFFIMKKQISLLCQVLAVLQ